MCTATCNPVEIGFIHQPVEPVALCSATMIRGHFIETIFNQNCQIKNIYRPKSSRLPKDYSLKMLLFLILKNPIIWRYFFPIFYNIVWQFYFKPIFLRQITCAQPFNKISNCYSHFFFIQSTYLSYYIITNKGKEERLQLNTAYIKKSLPFLGRPYFFSLLKLNNSSAVSITSYYVMFLH